MQPGPVTKHENILARGNGDDFAAFSSEWSAMMFLTSGGNDSSKQLLLVENDWAFGHLALINSPPFEEIIS